MREKEPEVTGQFRVRLEKMSCCLCCRHRTRGVLDGGTQKTTEYVSVKFGGTWLVTESCLALYSSTLLLIFLLSGPHPLSLVVCVPKHPGRATNGHPWFLLLCLCDKVSAVHTTPPPSLSPATACASKIQMSVFTKHLHFT